ncbi:type II toxin-antitoxin system VapB family antitoxin [Streptomyces sp. NPDC001812]|uniref:type II toxin-antitoxin system VapB family antitoxin n=1 Tax=unclassified Streptomyces TaxID=2593676 RepID=UPI00365C49C8
MTDPCPVRAHHTDVLLVSANTPGTSWTARTVIDIDDDKPAEAVEIFGTSTEAATVNAALEDAVGRRKRASFLTWPAEGGLPGLTGPVEETADGLGRPRRHGPLNP